MNEMPKAENPYGWNSQSESWLGFEEGSDARAKLAWEQGWRKVPSIEQILYRLAKGSGGGCLNDANELHRWLMEGE